jgi:8-oxo-dGTP pyrophosphatase MutT (NUDIX family)
VLLLQRSPLSGNPGTWGLPGGNADATDTCLLHTARREAEEEMGAVPEFEVLFELLTK